MSAIVWAVIGRRAEDRQTSWLMRLAEALSVTKGRIRARRQLAQVDARTLRDAGIDPMAARYEASQPFWVAEKRLRDR